MKVFWVLAWDTYYPEGGLENVHSTHATREEAEQAAARLRQRGQDDYVQVVDVSDLLGIGEG